MWIKNTCGKPDALFTMVCVTFVILCLNLILGTLGNLVIGSVEFSLNFIDAGVITAFWGPLLAAYVARRGTAHYFDKQEEPIDV